METVSAEKVREALARRLSESALFSYLTPDELLHIAATVGRREVRKGGLIFSEGDEGSELYLVESGRVAISKAVRGNIEQVLAHMGPGDYFGEMALLEQIPRTASASAEEDTALLIIGRDDLFTLMESQPRAAAKIMFNLLRTFTSRLHSTNEQLRETVRWGLEATGFQPEV